MIKRLFSTQSKTITGAAILLAGASFISRLIGVFRDRIFAHQFGAAEVLDAYYAAFRIPDLVYNLIIVGALSAGFIPLFSELWHKKKQDAWALTNAVILVLGSALVALCTILFFYTPKLVPHLVPGFDAGTVALTTQMTRIMFISPILLGISAIVSGALQARKSFLVYSLTPIMYNLGIIFGAMVFAPILGPIGLAYGVLLGAFLHLIIQLPALYNHGFRFQWLSQSSWQNIRSSLKELWHIMIPRTLGLASHQVNLLVITIIASTLSAGSVAIFNFANNLQYFPIGLIGISFAVAAFPTLSQFAAEGKKEKIAEHISQTARQILFFILPLTIIFLLLRAQIVRVLLGSGAFDWNDTILTADALAFFSLSLFAQCLSPLLARGFYAIKDTWTPFVIAFVSMLINIWLALELSPLMGTSGLALSFSIAMIVQMALLWITLRIRIGSLGEGVLLWTLSKITIATIGMTICVQLLKAPIASLVDMNRFWGIAMQGALAGIAGLIVYSGISYLLRVQEMHHLAQSMKKKWVKKDHIQGDIRDVEHS